MRSLRERVHDHCFACGLQPDGLGLRFHDCGEAGVAADWQCLADYQSYPGVVHGGIVATLLDSAMTNCLLARGIEGMTADLEVDFRRPLCVGGVARVTARVVRSRPPLYVLESSVEQGGVVRARASGRFAQVGLCHRGSDVR